MVSGVRMIMSIMATMITITAMMSILVIIPITGAIIIKKEDFFRIFSIFRSQVSFIEKLQRTIVADDKLKKLTVEKSF